MGGVRISLGALVGSALVLSGCPSSSTQTVPIEDLGATYGSVSCDIVADCYGEAIVAVLVGATDHGACVARAEAAYTNGALPRYQAAIAMGTLTYDGSQAGACVDALRGLGCEAIASRTPSACDSLFVGHVATGGACALDEECEGAAYCRVEGACPGTCQPYVAAGGACTRNEACASGLRCTSGACMAPGGAGASCQGATGVECAGGLICRGGTATDAGTCTATSDVFAAASGAACSPGNGQLCMAGLSCIIASATSQTCGPDGLAAGSACQFAIPDQCADGFYCMGASLSTTPPSFDGTCAPLPTAGMACVTGGTTQSCADGSVCEANVCVEVQDNGGACTTDADCYGSHCTGGVCTAPTYCPT